MTARRRDPGPEAYGTARRNLGTAAALAATCTTGRRDALRDLETIEQVRFWLDQAEALLIDQARAEDATWGAIAARTKRTREAEYRRWRRRVAYEALDPFDKWLHTRTGRLPRQAQEQLRSMLSGPLPGA